MKAISSLAFSCLSMVVMCADKTNLERFVSIPSGSTFTFTDKSYTPVRVQ